MSKKPAADWSCKHDILILNKDGSYSHMDEPYYEAEKIAPGTWKILSSGDHSYLVEGENEAISIDTGYGAGNIRDFLQTLTDKPVRNTFNTHSHFDHSANNGYFEKAYLAFAGIPYASVPYDSFAGIDFPQDYERIGVKEGFIYDLGGRTLEVFDIPDHTTDGIALLDRKERLLFTGDEFMEMGKPLHISIHTFYEYLEKLEAHRSEFDRLCAGANVFDASLLDSYYACAKQILSGNIGNKMTATPFGGSIRHKAPAQPDPAPNGALVYDRMLPHPGDHGPDFYPQQPGYQPDMYILEYRGAKIMYDHKKLKHSDLPQRAGDYHGAKMEKRIPKLAHFDLDIRTYFDRWIFLPDFDCYCLQDVVYCSAPKEPNLQCLNLFVPKAYLQSNGCINQTASCGAYTAKTAPIIIQSAVMGYSEAPASMLNAERPGPDQALAVQFLKKGMIFLSAAARGRQTQDEFGNYIGKAPALVTDVKAAIRFYRHNQAYLPGNTDRMIFFGVSAGGNLATLIGSTCDHPDFDPFLREIGAVMEESDSVYAVQAFCPITDLAHADPGYEWMYQGHYQRDLPPFMADKAPNSGHLTDFQQALSKELGARYIQYLNSLSLSDPVTGEILRLNADGRSGTFYDALIRELEASATKYIQYLLSKNPKAVSCSLNDYLSGNYTITRRGPRESREIPGIDKRDWLSWDGKRAHISSSDTASALDAMLSSCTKRMKNCPSFDSLELAEFENEEFGHPEQKLSHFSIEVAAALEGVKESFPEEYQKFAPEFTETANDTVLQTQNKLLNPHSFISPGAANLCPHFRIRVGNMDPHTSFSTAMLVAYNLKQAGIDVDFAFTWEQNHGVCDYDGEFWEWIESII